MKRWGWFVFGVLVAAAAVSAFAQSEETMNSMLDNTAVAEPDVVPEADAPATDPVVDPMPPNEDASQAAVPPQWVWGEVTAVDPTAGTLEIKHLDYETYEELKKTITVAKTTVFENAANLSEVKVGDKVTIDYRPREGLKVADMIVVEKEDGAVPAAAEPAVEPAPAEPVTASLPMNVEAPVVETAPVPETPPADMGTSPANTETVPDNAEAAPGNVEAPVSNDVSSAADNF